MFQGNEPPEQAVSMIQKLISKHCCGENINIYSLNETDLAKLAAKSIFEDHCSKPKLDEKKLSGDRFIEKIGKMFNLSNPISLAVDFSRYIVDVHCRYLMGETTPEDREFVGQMVQFLHVGFYHESTANTYHYNQRSKSIISQIFFKFFDEKGNAKKEALVL